MKYLVLLLSFLTLSHVNAAPKHDYRVQKFAAFKAHAILPDSLRFLVKRNGRHLFEGIERGMATPLQRITLEQIMGEKQKISGMVQNQRPFKEVVFQMGYAVGLLAKYIDPSAGAEPVPMKGFQYYLNLKLNRFYFVFDGYSSFSNDGHILGQEIQRIHQQSRHYELVLKKRYAQVNNNPYHKFSEKSAIFGISSLYYSNLARLSAHLWYHAWVEANGDLTDTPFVQKQVYKPKRGR